MELSKSIKLGILMRVIRAKTEVGLGKCVYEG